MDTFPVAQPPEIIHVSLPLLGIQEVRCMRPSRDEQMRAIVLSLSKDGFLFFAHFMYNTKVGAFFSIIIPTLNEEHYVPHLLADLDRQATKDFEVIIVDASSTDKTKEKALEFQNKFPVQFLISPKKNVSFQRNFGAQKAKGEYCVFLDADVRLTKDFLTQIKLATQRKHNGLFLPYMLPEDTSQKTKVMISFVNTLIRMSQTYGKPLAPGGNLIVSADVFKKVGGFSEDVFISEDHDFVRRAYKMGFKARILRNAKLYISMRRSKAEGDMALIYKYILAFLMYTMTPGNKSLKKKLFEYEMGGHRYLLDNLQKKEKSKKGMQYLRQLLQID